MRKSHNASYRGAALSLLLVFSIAACAAQLTLVSSLAPAEEPVRKRSDPPPIVSSWDDLLEGVNDAADWDERRKVLKQRYLDLLRDDFKPKKPPLDLQVHETAQVDGIYERYVYFKPIRPGLLEGRLPNIDFHEIIALIAPRPFLDLSATNDGIPGTQRQRVLMLTKLMDVWELEKQPQNFAFCVHGRGHSLEHESRALMHAWMDFHLKPPDSIRTRRVDQAAPSTKKD